MYSLKSTPAALCALALLAGGVPAARAADIGAPAPDFVLKSLGGSNLRLSEYRGEVVAIAFWASWCGDCRRSLDHLAALEDRYADLGLRMLAVSLDGDRLSASRAAGAANAAYPVLLDSDGAVGEAYAADSLPAIVVVDRSGQVRERVSGAGDEADARIRDRIRSLLRE